VIPRPNLEYLSIEEDLIALFQYLLAEMPPNDASFEVRRVGRFKEGIQVTLTPRNSGAASIWVHAENGTDLVDFGFGDWTNSWELPTEGRNSKARKVEVLQEITDLCKAVIAGHCSYERGFLSRTASVLIEGRPPYRITDIPVFRSRPPLRGTRFYEPYTLKQGTGVVLEPPEAKS
jgi:hypothetical protein